MPTSLFFFRINIYLTKKTTLSIPKHTLQLEDEVIADFAGSLALNTDVFDTFVAEHAEKKSMWQTILEVLKAIRDFFAADSVEAGTLQDAINKLELLAESASEKVAEGTVEQNAEARNSAKDKRKSAITTESAQKEHQPSVVVIADNANILKNIDSAIKEYENAPYTKGKTFLGNAAKLLNAEKRGSNSQYATFEAINGKIFTIRLSDHNATIKNFDNNNEKEGISIVITPGNNTGVNKGGDAHIVEFFYDSIKLRKAEGKPLAEILKSIKQALYSGEYKDTTGLAQKEEVNALFSLKEMDADYLDAVERGDMETAQRMVMEAAAIAMPETKIVDVNRPLYHHRQDNLGLFLYTRFIKSDDKD